MPYLIPPRTPLTPEQVERAFDYLLALQTGGGSNVAGRADADPELAFLLLRVAEDVIWPMAAVGEESDPHSDSFALEEVGCILLSALRDWAQDSPTTGALGIARSIIRFVVNVFPAPDDEDVIIPRWMPDADNPHGDTATTLETIRDEHLVLAHAMHSAPGTHR
ncbi:hypothetical protein [Streptomyces chryseus]|uniref:Uncharacterized protein n=1 Tax=Streptomyces chryseus TaxID=68186 RepID=A0ABQ3EFN2_9ACTN|nr:hypothetical protein [Streptomyces chryseus]GHB32540.1 hypothetical protein GCM10010346_64800 [Streptomyces chryseus]